MKISREEVVSIANLARLQLDEDKIDLFSSHFNNILEYMEKIGEIDTTSVEPLYSPVEHTTVLREDEVKKEYERDEVLENAPESDGQYFIVPKIIT